jgi:hypothetical protein
MTTCPHSHDTFCLGGLQLFLSPCAKIGVRTQLFGNPLTPNILCLHPPTVHTNHIRIRTNSNIWPNSTTMRLSLLLGAAMIGHASSFLSTSRPVRLRRLLQGFSHFGSRKGHVRLTRCDHNSVSMFSSSLDDSSDSVCITGNIDRHKTIQIQKGELLRSAMLKQVSA